MKRPVLLATVLLLAAPAAAQDRIVSVDGAVTEIVFALGQQHRLVGTDTSSTWPEAAGALPKVGYKRALSAEGLLSLGPDLILGTKAAGPVQVLDRVEAAGVPVTLVPDEASVDGVLAKIDGVARALGVPDRGAALIAAIRTDLEDATRRVGEAGQRPRVLFLMETGQGGLMAAGRETAADAILTLAGGVNAFAGVAGLKPLTPEAAVAARPDVLVLTTQAVARQGGVASILARPDLSATPAARAGRVVVVDTLQVLGFGPRIASAVSTLADGLHAAPATASAGAAP